MTMAETKALDAIAVTALAKWNKLAKRSQLLLNLIFTLLLVGAITFSVLGYLRVTSLITLQNKRAADNHALLATIKEDDKILKTATGPGTVAASARQLYCLVNRMDADTQHAQLDPTCPKFDK